MIRPRNPQDTLIPGGFLLFSPLFCRSLRHFPFWFSLFSITCALFCTYEGVGVRGMLLANRKPRKDVPAIFPVWFAGEISRQSTRCVRLTLFPISVQMDGHKKILPDGMHLQ